MVLVDTSVWVSHLRTGEPHLRVLLQNGEVLCHPFIVGELACEQIKNRNEILALLQALPLTRMAGHEEILRFIETQRLMGGGLGLVDVHLLAAASLSMAPLWTVDKHLKAASERLNIDYE
ncbi:MAG: VapC toxin family PIN domain ribonuclease [Chloroflexota bacterium]|nr:VapC toxin family PIN domain ribonuclease [Chloroflexota bacterium]